VVDSIGRLRWHPTDRSIVVLDVPSVLNHEFRRFEPALLSKELHGYVMHHDAIPSLYRFARTIDLHIVDERQKAKTGGDPAKRTYPHECRHCAQPGSTTNPPRRCPRCGKPWEPVTPRLEDTAKWRTTLCEACGHRNRNRFPYCAHCGEALIHDDPTSGPPPLQLLERTRLPDPVRLRDALPRSFKGRRVEDVQLPEPEDT
jgi:hypothetical protein